MIPKVIHYCWFGGKPLPEDVQNYIKSWKTYLPDFEIKQWDEHNFDVNSMEYTRQAYFARKYAFVSDVARLYALITEGGLYLDTDILIKKRFPEAWFEKEMFVSFEHDKYVQTGIIASIPHHPILEEFYLQYKNRQFICGSHYDISTNVSHFTHIMENAGFIMNNHFQERDGVAIFPQELLCGKDWKLGRYDTEKTIAVHDFQGTWGRDALQRKLKFFFETKVTILKWYLWGRY